MTLAATAPAADFPATTAAPHRQFLTGLGLLLGVTLAPLIAFNQTPSATLYNQLMAFAGLGLLVAGLAWGRALRAGWRNDGVSLSLLLMTAVALAAPFTHGLPWSMSLTSIAMLLGALLAVQTGRAVVANQRDQVLTLFCVALVGAGVLSVVVSLIQMFFPSLADATSSHAQGSWVARSATCASPITLRACSCGPVSRPCGWLRAVGLPVVWGGRCEAPSHCTCCSSSSSSACCSAPPARA